MMLLTRCKVDLDTTEGIFRILPIYLTRWKCEESHPHINPCCTLEDFRVRALFRIRGVVAVVLASRYFAAVDLGQS